MDINLYLNFCRRVCEKIGWRGTEIQTPTKQFLCQYSYHDAKEADAGRDMDINPNFCVCQRERKKRKKRDRDWNPNLTITIPALSL